MNFYRLLFSPFLFFGVFFYPPLSADEALDFLKSEIQRTARQRDEARKQLLEARSEAEMQVQSLSESQFELNRQLETNARELLNLEAAARMSRSSVERAEAELRARNTRIQSLENQKQQNLKNLRGLEQQLEDMRATEAGQMELRRDYQDLQKTMERRNAELEELRTRREQSEQVRLELSELNSQLREEVRSVRRSEALATAKQAALEARLDHLQSELAQQYELRSALEQEQERLREVIAELQTRVNEADSTRVPRAELEEVRGALREAMAENQNLREDLLEREEIPDLRKDFERVRRERDLLQATQKTLTGRLEQMKQSMETASGDNQMLREENQQLSTRLQEETNRGRALEEKIAGLENELKAAQAAGVRAEKLARVEKKLENLETQSAEFERVRAQRDQLLLTQNHVRGDMKTLAQHIYDLREKLVESEGARRQLVLAEQRRRGLARDLYESKKDINVLNRLNEALVREDERKEKRIRDLRAGMAAGRTRAESLKAEKEALQKELERIQSKLNPVQQE